MIQPVLKFLHFIEPNRSEEFDQYREIIDGFGDKNKVTSSNFNSTILKISEKFDHLLSHVFIFCNMIPESHGFVAMQVTSCINDTCSNLFLSNQ